MALKFNVCQRTVIKTLQACNVSTHKKIHTEEEFKTYCKARELFNLGLQTNQIKQYFSIQKVNAEVVIHVLKENFGDRV